MNRQAEIREFLSRQHPDIHFTERPPTPAGFWFGIRTGRLVPIVHVVQLWDRTAELSDEEFQTCLYGLSEVFSIVERLTEGDPTKFNDEMTGTFRAELMARMPEVEEVMARVFDLPAENL